MKIFPILLVFFSSLVSAQEMPPIKAGLWESSMVEDGKPTSSKHCIGDQTSLKDIMDMTRSLMQGMCEGTEVKKSGNSYISKLSCNMGVTKLDVESVIAGDFDSEYTVNTKSTMNPPLMGNAGSTSSGVSKYQGDCPADMKPGDVVLADGKKMNVNEASKKLKEQLGNVDMKQLQQMQQQMQKMMGNK